MASPERLAAASSLLSAGAWRDAEAAARAAMGDEPDDPQAVLLLGLAVAASGEADRAAAILNRAAELRPDAEHPCTHLVRLRPRLARLLVARQFRACLRLAPADTRLRSDFADFLLTIGQPGAAARILATSPESAERQHQLGLAQAAQNAFASAIVSFERAVALDPLASRSWSSLGMALLVEGYFDEAIAAHDRAVALEPDNPRFRVNRAVALLKAGRWRRAWQDYEVRQDPIGAPAINAEPLLPTLRPGHGLTGQTIVVPHQGRVDDTLQFLRYLPLLAQRGARVIACVPPALVRLVRMVPGVAEVITGRRRLPAHNFVCPMVSLPRVFATTVETIPPVPELAIDAALIQRWRNQLPPGGFRVGLVWADQPRLPVAGFAAGDRQRNPRLTDFAPLFDVPGATFVSLQAGPAARQQPPAGVEMVNPMQGGPMQGGRDLADIFAIIASLDVVVSVDSAVVHLAGLAGKPVFLLDRYDGSWRWLSGRADSPWYPTVTIFRQERPADWTAAIARAAASLHAMAMFRGFGATPGGVREANVPRLTGAPIAWREAVPSHVG